MRRVMQLVVEGQDFTVSVTFVPRYAVSNAGS